MQHRSNYIKSISRPVKQASPQHKEKQLKEAEKDKKRFLLGVAAVVLVLWLSLLYSNDIAINVVTLVPYGLVSLFLLVRFTKL